MTPDTWDVVVIGAGPAGALSACLLARAGAGVLLVERQAFPRAKTCGGCLNASAVASLERAGLGDRVRALGARRIDAIELRSGWRTARIPLPEGLAVSRAALDAELAAAAVASGAVFTPETTAIVAGNERTGAFREWRRVSLQPRLGSSSTVRTRVVLAADGLAASSLREYPAMRSRPVEHSRIGVGAIAPAGAVALGRGSITMAIDRHGYVGAVEVEAGRVNVAAAFDPAFLRAQGSPAAAVTSVLDGAGVEFDRSLETLDWAGTVPLTRRMAHPAARRLFVLGDAAGYVEPFTGEGIAWALASAEAAVPLVRRAMESWDDSLEREWVEDSARRHDAGQRWCRAISRTLRVPLLVGSAIALLRRQPGLAGPVLSQLAPRAPAR